MRIVTPALRSVSMRGLIILMADIQMPDREGERILYVDIVSPGNLFMHCITIKFFFVVSTKPLFYISTLRQSIFYHSSDLNSWKSAQARPCATTESGNTYNLPKK